jgi:hypothetical protein
VGKLLSAFGEDNVIWGTDSAWYGPTQPLIDAFKAFTIPEDMRASEVWIPGVDERGQREDFGWECLPRLRHRRGAKTKRLVSAFTQAEQSGATRRSHGARS